MCTPSLPTTTFATLPSVVVQPPPSSSQETLAIPDSWVGSLPVTVSVCGPLTHAGAGVEPLYVTDGVWLSIWTCPLRLTLVE